MEWTVKSTKLHFNQKTNHISSHRTTQKNHEKTGLVARLSPDKLIFRT